MNKNQPKYPELKSLASAFLLTLLGASSCTESGSSRGETSTPDGAEPDASDLANSGGGSSELPPIDPEACSEVSTFEVRNDRAFTRSQELAWSSLPLSRALGARSISEFRLAGSDGDAIHGQMRTVARWGSYPGDEDAPLKWVEVALVDSFAAEETKEYLLVHCPGSEPSEVSSLAQADGDSITVDTTAASFRLSAEPHIVDAITRDGVRVYEAAPGDGPRLDAPDGQARTVIDSMELEESGPVKAVVSVRGHFLDQPQNAHGCSEPPGFVTRLSFVRGSADIGIEFDFVNECGGGQASQSGAAPDGSNWWSQRYQVEHLGWAFSGFQFDGSETVGAIVDGVHRGDASTASTRVVQHSREDSSREATVEIDGAPRDSANEYQSSAVLVSSPTDDVSVIAALPWMRYREPQALSATTSGVAFEFIAEPFTVGEAQGTFHFAHLALREAGEPADALEWADQVLAHLERGLLPRAPVDYVNSTGVFPRLPERDSEELRSYLQFSDQVHADTVDPGESGLLATSKIYSLTAWPDSTSESRSPADAPIASLASFAPGSNVWSPTNSELLLWFVTGDPKWVWDMSLPAEWLLWKTNAYNTGSRVNAQGTRNGFVVANGGAGSDGLRYRSGYGSDDKFYNQGSDKAYVVRPLRSLAERFVSAGETYSRRYIADTDGRSATLSERVIGRQVMQHFNALRLAAAFAPSAGGSLRALQDAVVAEYVQDNLNDGTFCFADDASENESNCVFAAGGQFHFVALWQEIFYSLLNDAQATESDYEVIEQALGETADLLLSSIPTQSGEIESFPSAEWGNSYRCDFSTGQTPRDACTAFPCVSLNVATDGQCLGSDPTYGNSHLGTLATIGVARANLTTQYVQATSSCEQLRRAFALNLTEQGPYYFSRGGWYKAVSQMNQMALYGIGAFEACAD